jgi:hypothetical protein
MASFAPPPVSALEPEEKFTPPPPTTLEPKSFTEHASDALSEFGDTVRGGVTGTAKALVDLPGFFESWIKENQAIGDKAVDAFKNGRYAEGATHFANLLANSVPGMGSASEQTAEDLKNGDYGKAVGRLAAIATLAKAPDLVSGAASLPGKVSEAAANNPNAVLAAKGAAKTAAGTAMAAKGLSLGPIGEVVGVGGGGTLARSGLRDIIQSVKNARSTESPKAAPASASITSEPPMAGPLNQLTDYFKARLQGQLGSAPQPGGASFEPAEAPAGKSPIEMPGSSTKFNPSEPSKEFTAEEYKKAAQTDKSGKLAKSLQASGIRPDDLQLLHDHATPEQVEEFWKQAAKEASDFHGEPVNPPNSAVSRSKTMEALKFYTDKADTSAK